MVAACNTSLSFFALFYLLLGCHLFTTNIIGSGLVGNDFHSNLHCYVVFRDIHPHRFCLCGCFLVQKCIEPAHACQQTMPSFYISANKCFFPGHGPLHLFAKCRINLCHSVQSLFCNSY
jgi:hypothetical protein